MAFILVPAEEKDIEEIMKIEEACFIPSIQETKAVFLSRMRKNTFLLFIDENENIAGYISAEFIEKIPSKKEEIALNHLPAEKNSPYIYISSFAIHPSYQGSGLGKIFWKMACEEFFKIPGVETLVLLVNSEWKGALHIYEKSGFETISVFEDFFPCEDGKFSDGILMAKNI